MGIGAPVVSSGLLASFIQRALGKSPATPRTDGAGQRAPTSLGRLGWAEQRSTRSANAKAAPKGPFETRNEVTVDWLLGLNNSPAVRELRSIASELFSYRMSPRQFLVAGDDRQALTIGSSGFSIAFGSADRAGIAREFRDSHRLEAELPLARFPLRQQAAQFGRRTGFLKGIQFDRAKLPARLEELKSKVQEALVEQKKGNLQPLLDLTVTIRR